MMRWREIAWEESVKYDLMNSKIFNQENKDREIRECYIWE